MDDADLINEYKTAPGDLPTDRVHLSYQHNHEAPAPLNLSLYENKANHSLMPAPFSHYAGSNLKKMFSKDQIIFESSINELPSDRGHMTFEES
jgi:hypothetical protein